MSRAEVAGGTVLSEEVGEVGKLLLDEEFELDVLINREPVELLVDGDDVLP